NCLPKLETRGVPLGDLDHSALRINSLKREKRCRRRHIITDAHESLADYSGKRRAHIAPRDLKLQHGECRVGTACRSLRSFEISGRRRILIAQPLNARELLASEIAIG